MFELIKDYMRKRCLRKCASTAPTGLLPQDEVHTALALVDVEDNSFNDCVLGLQNYFREHDIRGEIIYFDFRRLGKDEKLITKVNNTVLRKELSWYGRPGREKTQALLEGGVDMFLCLVDSDSFPVHYVAACANARFKAGRRQIGNIYDLVVVNPQGSNEKEALEQFKEIMAKIR